MNLLLYEIKELLLDFDELPKSRQLKQLNPVLYADLLELMQIYNYESTRLVAYLIMYDIYPEMYGVCSICKVKYLLRIDANHKLSIVCSHSCELKRRHLDPAYILNIKTKSMHTKDNTIIDGLNAHQRGSNKAAITTKLRYTKDEISSYLSLGVKNHSEYNIHIPRRVRIIRVLEYFGVSRSIILYFKLINLKLSYLNYIKRIQKICKYISYHIPDIELLKKIYFVINNITVEKVCPICNIKFKTITFISEFEYKIKYGVFCGASCRQKHNMTSQRKLDLSVRMNKLYEDLEEHNKTSIHSIESWKTRDSSEWVSKYLTTLGEEGKKKRTKSALNTKLERGHISVINPDNNTEYRKYKNNVISLTRKLDLSSLDNILDRGKKTYHLDHIFPTSRGFSFNIPDYLIAHIDNVRLIWHNDNRKKSATIIEVPKHILLYLQETNEDNYRLILNEIIKNTKI